MAYLGLFKKHLTEISHSAWFVIPVKLPTAFLMGSVDFLIGDANHAMAKAIFILMCIDFITALMAKFKIKEPIESRKALKSVSKVAIYGMFLSAAHLTGMIVPGVDFIDRVAASFLALTEFISIMENIGKMGYAVPQKLLNQMQKMQKAK